MNKKLLLILMAYNALMASSASVTSEAPAPSDTAKTSVARLKLSSLVVTTGDALADESFVSPKPKTLVRTPRSGTSMLGYGEITVAASAPKTDMALPVLAATTADALTHVSSVSPKPRTLVRTPRSRSMLGYGEITDAASTPRVDLASLVLAATTGDMLTHESLVDAKPRTLVHTPSLLGYEDMKALAALVNPTIKDESLSLLEE